MPTLEELEARITKNEDDMALHTHNGEVSAKINLLKASETGNLLIGDSNLEYSSQSVGSDDTFFVPDSSQDNGWAFVDAYNRPMTLLEKAQHGYDDLIDFRLKGLYNGIESDDTRFLERLTIDSNGSISSGKGLITFTGESGTGGDDHTIKGISGEGDFDIDGTAEMFVTIRISESGSGAVAKTLLVGWGDVGNAPPDDSNSYTYKHIGFWGYATSITGDHTVYASVGDGGGQYKVSMGTFNLADSRFHKFRILVEDTGATFIITEPDGTVTTQTILKTDSSDYPTADDSDYLPYIISQNESGVAGYQNMIVKLNGYFVNTIN